MLPNANFAPLVVRGRGYVALPRWHLYGASSLPDARPLAVFALAAGLAYSEIRCCYA